MRDTYAEGQEYARYTENEYGLGRIKEDLKALVRVHLDNDFDRGYYDECVRIDAVETAVAEAQRELMEAITGKIKSRMKKLNRRADNADTDTAYVYMAQYDELALLLKSLEVK